MRQKGAQGVVAGELRTSISAASSIGASPSGVWKSGSAFCTLTPCSEVLPNSSPFTARDGCLHACMKRTQYASPDRVVDIAVARREPAHFRS